MLQEQALSREEPEPKAAELRRQLQQQQQRKDASAKPNLVEVDELASCSTNSTWWRYSVSDILRSRVDLCSNSMVCACRVSCGRWD